MTGESFFLDIAKVSITMAGFAGVIGALRHPKDRGWEANEIAGIKLMLEHSLAAVVLGLLPLVFYLYSSDEPMVWLLSSSLLTVFLAAEILINIARIKTTTAQGSPPRTFKLLLGTFFVPTIVLLIVQVMNVFYWRGPVAFAAGVVWLVVASCRQFLLFFWHIHPE